MVNVQKQDNLNLTVNGFVKIKIVDVHSGKTLYHGAHNTWTGAATEHLVKLFCGESSEFGEYCGVGSGTATAGTADTALGSEIGRVGLTSYTRTGTSVVMSYFFATGDCNGTWNEEGILSLPAGGCLFARTNLGTAIEKTSGKTITVDHTINIG